MNEFDIDPQRSDATAASGFVCGTIGAIATGAIIPLILIIANYGPKNAAVSIIPSLLLGLLVGWVIGTITYNYHH